MAPVIIFAFNRLDALINVITSLLLNEEAQESDLFVFVDGAREGKLENENWFVLYVGILRILSVLKV